ncbi:CD209 antigen-like protein E [Hoplias malabaricus]|uniref:CD209 antigen-like protein E n=1 Tax=Hoplias malabaricus TaxID=27720 RepID=UPI003462FE9C
MENIYENTDFQLSKIPRNEECHNSSDILDHTVQSVRGRSHLCSTQTLKHVLAVFSILLLCALVGLCAVGILYVSKGISLEALSEDYSRAVQRLSVQEHNANETERKYDELKVEHHRAQERVSQCSGNQNCALCGEGWTFYGLKCYLFSTDKLNWMKSRDACNEKGGHLVIITSKLEQDFVSSRVQENHWIGLNDLETEGKWMWVNNKPLTETEEVFWYERKNEPDEPDNWKHEDSSGEDCAALGNETGNTGSWFDASCQKLKKYICEK